MTSDGRHRLFLKRNNTNSPERAQRPSCVTNTQTKLKPNNIHQMLNKH